MAYDDDTPIPAPSPAVAPTYVDAPDGTKYVITSAWRRSSAMLSTAHWYWETIVWRFDAAGERHIDACGDVAPARAHAVYADRIKRGLSPDPRDDE